MTNHPFYQEREARREARVKARAELEAALARVENARVLLAGDPDPLMGFELATGRRAIQHSFNAIRRYLGEHVATEPAD